MVRVSLGRMVGCMIVNKFDWDSIPAHTLNIHDISYPHDLSNFFKYRGIDKYVYRITCRGIVLKYGMSAAKSRHRDWGERVYRQIAHCQSWGKDKIDGSSGCDWLIIERDFKNRYGIDIHHHDLSIKVWDVTNYDFKSVNPFNEIEEMETELIDMYTALVGEKPIGNINDQANKRNRAFVSKETADRLFVIE